MMQRLVVLNYHQVPEQPDPLRPTQVDRSVFREQVNTLRRYFHVIGLAEGIDAMRNNDLPSRAVAITFDDGYRDNHDVALDELVSARCPATFFIATDYLDGGRMWNDTLVESIRRIRQDSLSLEAFGLEGTLNLTTTGERIKAMRTLIPALKYLEPDAREAAVSRLASICGQPLPDDMMMTSAQVKNLAEAGMEIGAHTSSHPILLRLSDADAFEDIRRGRDALTRLLGQTPRFFAYPNGKLDQDFTHTHASMLPKLGFDAAFTTQWGYATRHMPAFELPRMGFDRNTGFKLALRVLRGFFDSPAEFSRAA